MKISIITINYNNAVGLQKTMQSVIDQNYSDMEYIVIDGGSNDTSVEVIKKFSKHLSYWVSEKDNGVYCAMNKGIKVAKGDYLLFLNSGDYFYNDRVLKNNTHHISNIDIIAFDINFINHDYDKIGTHLDKMKFSFLFNDTLAHQSVFIKKEMFKKIGYYDENLKIVSDWKFFLHAFVKSNCTYKAIHEVLTVYQLGGLSCSPEGLLLRRKERELVLKNEYPLFYEDYLSFESDKKILSSNRFKMLLLIEGNYLGMKVTSIVLKIISTIFKT